MKLLFFATHLEAESTIEMLKAKPLSSHHYRYKEGDLVITGIGELNASRAIRKWASLASEIWNVGFAGSFHPAYPVGSLHWISTIQMHNQPLLSLRKEGLRLLTVKEPLHSDKERNAGASLYDLVDMEGYAIAKRALLAKKPCHLVKIVSDLISNEGRKSIQENAKKLSVSLGEFLSKLQRCEKPGR